MNNKVNRNLVLRLKNNNLLPINISLLQKHLYTSKPLQLTCKGERKCGSVPKKRNYSKLGTSTNHALVPPVTHLEMILM